MIHLPNLIVDLALILGSAALVTLIFKKFKQPLVLGYIIAGILVGPNFPLFPTVIDAQNITTWAEIGVIFLLFSLGLEFSFKKLIKVGGSASITAVFEVATMLLLGFCTGKLLGWSHLDSIFLGGILSISSTTIIIRAFEELGVKNQKFAGLVFGILIVEDLVAILLLVILSTLALSQQFAGTEMMISLLKLGFFLVLWFVAGIFLIPTFLRMIRKLMSDETLLIVSLALCLLMVVLAVKVGFSPALGAFIMGSVLAETTKAEKIEHIVKPVKDLFGAIFFVSVGMLIEPAMLKEFAGPIAIITLVTVFGKFMSTTFGALISGQPLKQSVKAGMSLSQIGEFSFIIATLGLTLKVTSDFLYPIAVAVSAVTTFITPYLIRSSEPFYRLIEKTLPAKLVHRMNRYASNVNVIKDISEWKAILKSYAYVIVLNSVVISGLIFLSSYLLAPFVKEKIGNVLTGNILTAVIAMLCITPFLWALAMKKITTTTGHNVWLNQKYRGPLVILEIIRIVLAIFFVGFLLDKLFSPLIALIVALAIIITITVIFSRRLQLLYDIIEERFMYNLHARELKQKEGIPMREMLPWDAHIAEFEILPESPFIGKTLMELALREKFGINIARIERGKITINIPRKEERLYPGDNIFVIGTDEQLDQFRSELEILPVEPLEQKSNHEVLLQQFVIDKDFQLISKTIRESGIREKTNGLIVGIERGGQRILNPDSSTPLSEGDIIWIVGEKGIIEKLKNEKGSDD
ncbi:MAG: cation:proton antiporter [Bacteroidia bacterium]|nr:cation:proton antiporter [Bacteroidia bacterium]